MGKSKSLVAKIRPKSQVLQGWALTLVLINFWNLTVGITNLDIGSIWLLGKSLSDGSMTSGNYFTVYGPLGFLDWNIWEYGKLILFPLIYRIIVTSIAYFILFKNLINKFSFTKTLILLNTFLAITSFLFPPTFTLMSVLLVHYYIKVFDDKQINIRSVLAFEFFLSFITLVKLLYIQPLVILLILICYHNSNFEMKNNFRFSFLKKIFISGLRVALLIATLLTLLGFSFRSAIRWMHGYLELVKGYSLMIAEENGRLWEYFAISILMIIFFFMFKKTVAKPIFLSMLVIMWLSIRYGFNRHDSHSTFTFAMLVLLTFIVFLMNNSQKNLAFVIANLIFLTSVSNLNILTLASFTDRIQSFGNLPKLIDTRFRGEIHSKSESELIRQLGVADSILDELNNKKFTVLPWPSTLPKSLASNYVFFPEPQLFMSYTPWLDENNLKALLSIKDSPEIILSRGPISVDGRFPLWDSPKFQIGFLCNYSLREKINEWYIFDRLEKSRCGSAQIKVFESNTSSLNLKPQSGYLYFVNVQYKANFIKQIFTMIFKPLFPDYVTINNTKYRIVTHNSRSLYLASNFSDLSDPWQNSSNLNIDFENILKYEVFKVPLKI